MFLIRRSDDLWPTSDRRHWFPAADAAVVVVVLYSDNNEDDLLLTR